MSVWTIADLHLSFGIPNKSMAIFGEKWLNHPEKIRSHWLELIDTQDLVLIPGDISWALHPEDVKPDLEWIEALPGTKVMIRGNHDYWWSSLSKIEKFLPPSIHLIQNNAFHWKDVSISGARLWDTPEYGFQSFIDFIDNPKNQTTNHVIDLVEAERIFLRDLGRLETSLKQLSPYASLRIAMTHYPPIGADLVSSRTS